MPCHEDVDLFNNCKKLLGIRKFYSVKVTTEGKVEGWTIKISDSVKTIFLKYNVKNVSGLEKVKSVVD